MLRIETDGATLGEWFSAGGGRGRVSVGDGEEVVIVKRGG